MTLIGRANKTDWGLGLFTVLNLPILYNIWVIPDKQSCEKCEIFKSRYSSTALNEMCCASFYTDFNKIEPGIVGNSEVSTRI